MNNLINRGYWGIALYQPKMLENWGQILRTAFNFRADFISTIGHRYKKQCSDTPDAAKHIPVFHFHDLDSFLSSIPANVVIIPVEVNGKYDLRDFCHPERAVYVFGGEDQILPSKLMNFTRTISISTRQCLNLSVAAAIVMYDRHLKAKR